MEQLTEQLTKITISENTYSRIDIEKYKTAFEKLDDKFIAFCNKNNIIIPNKETKCKGKMEKTINFQALALLSDPEVHGKKYLTKEDCEKFFQQINLKSKDASQAFNKIDQKGIAKQFNERTKYAIKFPYEYNPIHVEKRKNAGISGDKEKLIGDIKNWWKVNLIDIPNDKWQLGHLDPSIADSSEKNLAWQPPLQGKYRDKFKWDNYFHKMWPTADKELIPNIDKYYTESEQKKLYEVLKKKFEKN